MRSKTSKVLHIAKAGRWRLWWHEWFGGQLWALCGAEITDWPGTRRETLVCDRCARKAGWRQVDDRLWFVPGSGIVAF
jgi:hypothetical protein